jgi:hypothetical protein
LEILTGRPPMVSGRYSPNEQVASSGDGAAGVGGGELGWVMP